jgi:hypothetical protein
MPPTTAPVTPAITADADTRERTRQMAGGTNGSGARRSIATKAPSRAAAATAATRVAGAVQPLLRRLSTA